MIYGYYLIMVMMLPTGDVHGEALDWYFTPYECIEQAQYPVSYTHLTLPTTPYV